MACTPEYLKCCICVLERGSNVYSSKYSTLQPLLAGNPENKTQHWYRWLNCVFLQWLLLLKCHLTRMQSVSGWFVPELVVRFTLWQSVSDSNAGSSVGAIWVPHVIKTWLIFRTLLLTISTANGESEGERFLKKIMNLRSDFLCKTTMCQVLTSWKQEPILMKNNEDVNDYFFVVEENKKIKMWELVTQQAKKGLRQPSVREKEEKRWAERQRVKAVERGKRGRIDKLQTACGCTDTSCETDKKKETEGGSERA